MTEKTELPRVLIGTTIYDQKEYCRKEFVENVKKFTYKNCDFLVVDNSRGLSYTAKLRRDRVPAVHVERGRNSRDALERSSNYLRKRALDGGYDYLLMLESDVFPRKDIIERLLSFMQVDDPVLQMGRRVVGAPYLISDGKTEHLCIFVTKIDEVTRTAGTMPLPLEQNAGWLDGTLKQVHGMGVGCTLIHRSILERFPFWYSELDDDRMKHVHVRKHPDVYFYLDLHNARIPVYCDTASLAVHKPSDWSKVKDV